MDLEFIFPVLTLLSFHIISMLIFVVYIFFSQNAQTGKATFSYNIARGYNFSPLVWAMGGGDIKVTMSQYTITWETKSNGYIYYSISGTYNLHFLDTFSEPIDISGIEWGTIYTYYDIWKNLTIDLTGKILE